MNKKLWIAITVVLWFLALAPSRDRCVQTWFSYGIDVKACPDGELRQSAELSVSSLRRGAPGQVRLQALGYYTTNSAAEAKRAPVPRVASIELSLTGAKNAAWPLEVSRWERTGRASVGELALPDVPDGDYQLHASYQTRLGKGEVSLPLALYTPARIHVITDRPLYEPGNTVRFRAVVLRARDLSPLDNRPGVWVIRDPDNEVLLEETAPAGE